MESRWLEELITGRGDQDGFTRLRAREMLVAIGEPALESLVELLGGSQTRLRWEAAKALTAIPEPAAIPGLILLLGDRRSEIGWLAAVGLMNFGNRSVPYVLQALHERAGSKTFRQASHHVLHDLSKGMPSCGISSSPCLTSWVTSTQMPGSSAPGPRWRYTSCGHSAGARGE
jgi:hypothetical protein